jgi:hypothetical protein
MSRFVEPVIYSQSAGNLGWLGESAYDVEMFYNRIAMVMDVGARVNSAHGPILPLRRAQVLEVAETLLKTAETAIVARRALPNTPSAEHDLPFKTKVAKARADLEAQKKPHRTA